MVPPPPEGAAGKRLLSLCLQGPIRAGQTVSGPVEFNRSNSERLRQRWSQRRHQVRFSSHAQVDARGAAAGCVCRRVRENVHASALRLIDPRDLTQLNDRASPGRQKEMDVLVLIDSSFSETSKGKRRIPNLPAKLAAVASAGGGGAASPRGGVGNIMTSR